MSSLYWFQLQIFFQRILLPLLAQEVGQYSQLRLVELDLASNVLKICHFVLCQIKLEVNFFLLLNHLLQIFLLWFHRPKCQAHHLVLEKLILNDSQTSDKSLFFQAARSQEGRQSEYKQRVGRRSCRLSCASSLLLISHFDFHKTYLKIDPELTSNKLHLRCPSLSLQFQADNALISRV